MNRFFWAMPFTTGKTYMTDHYKASIQFWEKSTRKNSRVVSVQVWYDENLDNKLDSQEKIVQFSTVLTEKVK